MPGIRAKRLRRPLLLAAFLALAACGVSSSTTPIFVEGIIGPGGGTLEAQGITVVIPPGAFDEERVCAIVPGPDSLPVDPAEGEILLLPGCKCIGPRGTLLEVSGTMRFCYDPADLPPQTSETELLLLEWNEALGFLVVVQATQDLVNHCFEDAAYGELGYVTIGVRIGPPPPDLDFVLYGTLAPPPPPVIAPQGLPVTTTGLFLADAEGLAPPEVLPGTGGATDYLPSSDGSRVLYSQLELQLDGRSLYTVDVAPPQDGRLVLPVGSYTSSDGLFGWLGTQDRVFHTHTTGTSFAVEPQGNLPSVHFSYVAGDGSGSVVDLRTRTAFSTFLDDVRISPDGTKALLRWLEFGKGVFTYCDVIDVDGNVLVSNVANFFADGRPSPRWMPDSSGIYYVENDGITVTELALRPNDVNFPDGYEALTLYTLNVVSTFLLDFVVAPPFPPAAQRCAYVYRDASLRGQVFGDGAGPDHYGTDTLAGDDATSIGLGDYVRVEEMVPAFADGFATSVVLLQASLEQQIISEQAAFPSSPDGHTLVFDLAGQLLVEDVPVPLPYLDLSRDPETAGQVLVWIDQIYDGYPQFPTAGVYLLDPLFGNAVDVTPPGFLVSGPPRWLHSWRRAPGNQPFSRVR